MATAKTVRAVLNNSARFHSLPPVTIWPAGCRLVQAPGASADRRVMPDGSMAEPVKTYPRIPCPPGVTDTVSIDGETFALTETHGPDYWAIVTERARRVLRAGELEFVLDGEAHAREDALRTETTPAAPFSGMDDTQAAKYLELEDSAETLRAWRAGARKSVQRLIDKRLKEIES